MTEKELKARLYEEDFTMIRKAIKTELYKENFE